MTHIDDWLDDPRLQEGLIEFFHLAYAAGQRDMQERAVNDQLATVTKERDELRELAKWREKYGLTGSSEIYDNPSAEFHKWSCETHNELKSAPVGWKHDCAALCTNDIELWIDRCPHCGKPAPEVKP